MGGKKLNYLGVWGSIVTHHNMEILWGGTKVGGVHKIVGNGNIGLSSSHFSSLMFFDFMWFGGVRQCWEQERTTCSGGYPSATCSAFLHYCDGAVSCNCFIVGFVLYK